MTVFVRLADGRCFSISGEAATVGRSEECDVSLPEDSRILAQHAVLRKVGGRWIIEAKADQLIRVGASQPARVNWVKDSDIIFLTESGPALVFETAPTAS